jgi:hypothetical protein
MMSDLRAAILANTDAHQPAFMVPVPEWGVEVGVRRLSLLERLTFEADNGPFEAQDRKDKPHAYNTWLIRYTIATACTKAGDKLFHPEDEEILAKKSATAIERIVLAAIKANVVTAEDIADLGKVSGAVPNGGSPSGSPVTSG